MKIKQTLPGSVPVTGRYRAEIDGMRAFAVIAVIINHFNKNMLPGGYLGVDIFFVISGYVITSSLSLRERSDFRDFISSFYARRIKRLLPALLIFVVLASILISLVDPVPAKPISTGIASLFGFSNLYLFRQATDYFAQSTELNPFTHTWSLGVEEQFYLFFPFLYYFSGFGVLKNNGTRNLLFCILLLSFASLLGFVYLSTSNMTAAYFLMPTRFWEIASGCLVYIISQQQKGQVRYLLRCPPIVLLFLMSGLMFMPVTFEVPSTLLMVFLSASLILSLSKDTLAYSLLSNKNLVCVGLMSYSLYLWHWPVLSIARWSVGITAWTVPVLVLIIFLFSFLSYRFVESPLRMVKLPEAKWKVFLVAWFSLLSTLFAVLFIGSNAISATLYLGRSVKPDDTNESTGGNCKVKKVPRIFLFGDSHAGQLGKVFSIPSLLCSYSPNVYQLGMYPSVPTQTVVSTRDVHSSKNALSESRKISSKYEEALSKLSRGDILLVSSRYLCRLKSNCFSLQLFWKKNFFYSDSGRQISELAAQESFIRKLREDAMQLQKKGVMVVLAMPTPEIRNDPSLCRKEWFRGQLASECFVNSDIQRDRLHFKGLFAARLGGVKNIVLFDPWEFVCPFDSGCVDLDSTFLHDATHISILGARKLATPLGDLLKDASLRYKD